MVAYLSKSDASEGFNQIIDFLNGSSIKYALTVNPNIYVSYIKQFWTTVAVKQVNDVTRLQALVDKKKQVDEEGDTDENVGEVNAGDVAHEDDSDTHGEVSNVTEEPFIPSPTPPTPPPQPPQDTLQHPRVVAAPSRRRKGVVIKDPESESTTSTIIPAKTKSKDKVIDHVKIKAKEDPAMKKYQAMKRKPQPKGQARNNMMLYLKNVVGFKMDYFKEIEEEENRALQKLNETLVERAAKRRKLDEEVEELKIDLQIMPNEDDNVYTEDTPLARKVLVVDYQIIEMNNKPYYKIIRADDTHQLYISFLSLLRNFDIEDLEALWSLVKERFSTSKPKNFADDFLLIITFTSTQLILLVERKYPASPVIVEPLRIELPFLEDKFQEDPPPEVPMADNRTMAKLLQAPTKGYEDAIQRLDESFYEAWDCFNDLLRACPHHRFFELHQLDTFYNTLNINDKDSLNSTAGGNFLDKIPRECLKIIKSKSKVRQSRAKAVVAKVSTSSSTPAISSEVAELKDMVRALLLDKKNQSSALASSSTP
nr:reverse transcriptase domain-containing protein [Tanacetum cinerariifolium]